MTEVDDHEFSAEVEESGEDSRSPSKELATARGNQGKQNTDNTTAKSTKGQKASFKELERADDGKRRSPAALKRMALPSYSAQTPGGLSMRNGTGEPRLGGTMSGGPIPEGMYALLRGGMPDMANRMGRDGTAKRDPPR